MPFVDVVAGAYLGIVLADLVGITAYTYIAIVVARVMRLLGTVDAWLYPLGFTLLAGSHAASLVAVQDIDARLALAAYTASSSLALAGLVLLALPRTSSRAYTITVTPALLVPLAYDAAAAAAAAAAALRFQGRAQILVAALAVVHVMRAYSAVLLPSGEGVLLLLVSELARSLAAALLAASYALPLARKGAG